MKTLLYLLVNALVITCTFCWTLELRCLGAPADYTQQAVLEKLILDTRWRLERLSVAVATNDGHRIKFAKELDALAGKLATVESTMEKQKVAINDIADLREEFASLARRVNYPRPESAQQRTEVEKGEQITGDVRLTTHIVSPPSQAGMRRANKTTEIRLVARVGGKDVPVAKRLITVKMSEVDEGPTTEIAKCYTDENGIAAFNWTVPRGGAPRKPFLHLEFAGDSTFLPAKSRVRIGVGA